MLRKSPDDLDLNLQSNYCVIMLCPESILMKTIAKFCFFVIFTAVISSIGSGCSFVSSDAGKPSAVSHYEAPKVVGKIKSPDITESSGIAASRCRPDVLWTHNDSGDDSFIYALDLMGNSLGTWRIPNAKNIDWEDIAAFKDKVGKCFLYIGEIGDNKAQRREHAIYRIDEPIVSDDDASSTRSQPNSTKNADVIRFAYPDFDQDAETLMVVPGSGDIYVITKRVSGPAGVYKLAGDFGGETVKRADVVGEISVPSIPNGFLTGGDISPDGKRVIICDYSRGYEYTLPENFRQFDDIWKQTPETVDLGSRSVGEAVTYNVDGTSIFATSEKQGSPLIQIIRRQ